MATRTNLDASAIAVIAQHFELGTPSEWSSVAGGTINSNYRIATERGRFFVRVNEGKSLQQVQYELALLEHWSSRGVRAPLPLASDNGLRYLLHEGQYLSAFPWLAGHHVGSRCIAAEHCEELGRALAQLHSAGQGAPPSLHKESRYSEQHLRALYATFARSQDPQLEEAVQIIGDEFRFLELHAKERAGLERGLIHADLFPDNVLLEEGRIVSLLDFEQACSGLLLYDLAVSINAWCFASSLVPERYQAMVASYCKARRIEVPSDAVLNIELRAAALRFVITRITDLYLRGEDAPSKDFRRFLMRLVHWRSCRPTS